MAVPIRIRRGGFRIRKIAETGEFRVAPTRERVPNSVMRERMAYYTDDAKDARGTAATMIRGDRKKFEKVKAKYPDYFKGKVYSKNVNAAGFKLSALRPGMIELGRKLDLGEMRPDYDKMYPCSSSSSSNVPKKKVYPSIYIDRLDQAIDLPDKGEGKVKFRVRRREERVDEDGNKYHGGTIEILSIETDDKGEKKPVAKKVAFERVMPGVIGFDNRPRNGNGQFEPEVAAGPTPNTMAAAYGGVQEEKIARRRSLLARLGITGRKLAPGV